MSVKAWSAPPPVFPRFAAAVPAAVPVAYDTAPQRLRLLAKACSTRERMSGDELKALAEATSTLPVGMAQLATTEVVALCRLLCALSCNEHGASTAPWTHDGGCLS
jgi:hypothetical protein